jgi:Na+/H+ antiporter NhaD/arsenite permease-like protein
MIFIDFILKEWLVVTSGVGLVLTAFYTNHLPYYSIREIEVLFILFVLFIVVNGLQRSGLILKIARSIEKRKVIPLNLVLITFILSMIVTNDIALIVIVPLTLSLNVNRKDVLVIFEVLAANSGSALTPIGNPQNLYIYWFYGVKPFEFIKAIAPFSLIFLCLLIISASLLKIKTDLKKDSEQKINRKAYFYGILLFIVLLTVFRVLPVLTAAIVIFFALIFDRSALHIDYGLLFSFLFFFGIADNLKIILASQISHSGHIFMFSALVSQVTSNVPATLLFVKFTSNWQALLWGVNAGGFGSLFGSLANLIAYKIYITHESKKDTAIFTAKFLAIGYGALFVSIGLYFVLSRLKLF